MKRKYIIWEILAFIAIIIGLLVLIAFLYQVSRTHNLATSEVNLQNSFYSAGFIGGVVGTLWSFASILLFLGNLVVQKEQIELQNKQFLFSNSINLIYKQIEIVQQETNKIILSANKYTYDIPRFANLLNNFKKGFFDSYKPDNETVKEEEKNPENREEQKSELALSFDKLFASYKKLQPLLEISDLSSAIIDHNLLALKPMILKINNSIRIMNQLVTEQDLNIKQKKSLWDIFIRNLEDELYIIMRITQIKPYKFNQNATASEILSIKNRMIRLCTTINREVKKWDEDAT